MGREFTEVVAGARRIPLYLLQFDKRGACTSAETRAALLEGVKARDYTDVYVFAHGWNNGFEASLELFQNFFRRFAELRPADDTWRPVFIGLQWPSIVLVFPWERGPKLAADSQADPQRGAIDDIASALSEVEAIHFRELAHRGTLSEHERAELLRLTRRAIENRDTDEFGEDSPDETELLVAWRALQSSAEAQDTNDDFGFARDVTAPAQSAGLDALDPRNLIRVATVYTMKDRAGVIGSVSLRSLLEDLDSTHAPVRLIGHSFGARVVLAALATAQLSRKVRSALLLQPAVNQFCLAEAGQIPNSTRAGGFNAALSKLALPLYSSFSAKDFPLHETFHLSVRRTKDLGEAEIAAGAPPSIYCALGGYGPRGLNAAFLNVHEIQDTGSYSLSANVRVVALDGTRGRINGHGDVANRFTCWALVDQDQRNT
jgi:hypothetical protein